MSCSNGRSEACCQLIFLSPPPGGPPYRVGNVGNVGNVDPLHYSSSDDDSLSLSLSIVLSWVGTGSGFTRIASTSTMSSSASIASLASVNGPCMSRCCCDPSKSSSACRADNSSARRTLRSRTGSDRRSSLVSGMEHTGHLTARIRRPPRPDGGGIWKPLREIMS